MVNKILKHLFYKDLKEFPVIKEYQEYLNFLEEDQELIKIVIFTKEDCDQCLKGLKIVSDLKDKYQDKIKIVEVKLFKDSTKNQTPSRLLDQYNINFVPNYILVFKNNWEKISNKDFKYLDSRIISFLK